MGEQTAYVLFFIDFNIYLNLNFHWWLASLTVQQAWHFQALSSSFITECVFVLYISMAHQGRSLLVVVFLYLSDFVNTKWNVTLVEVFYYCTILI
jgi:hypothetical protein